MMFKRLVLSFFLALFLFAPTSSLAQEEEKKTTLQSVNEVLAKTLFFDISFGLFDVPAEDRDGNPIVNADGTQQVKKVNVPLVLVVLVLGGVLFTLYLGFINIRAFRHAIDVTRGKYDKDEDAGDVSHFKALTSALSATIGLGNIAGVAIAIQVGGPGAALWMMIVAFFGMNLKFVSCTLSQLYRKVNPDGSISGGPMYYLDLGLKEKGKFLAQVGKIFAIFYATFVAITAFGAGGMFQVNQTVEAINATFGFPKDLNLILGVVIAVLVGAVIIGGIKKIGAATSKIVPLMFVIYVLACIFVVITNIDNLIPSIKLIFTMAFTENAAFGGLIGVIVTGVTRGAFSNEAGMGSAAIAHAAAKTNEPVREGVVAMLGPLIDTIIVCFMTALVVVITGTWDNPELVSQGRNIGVTITTEAFRTVIPWFPYVLTVCIGLFAYSSIIAWSYYGERGWLYIVDHFKKDSAATLVYYRILLILILIVGAVSSLEDVINFTDMVFISLGFPNIIGCLILLPKIKAMTKDYMQRLKAGEFDQ